MRIITLTTIFLLLFALPSYAAFCSQCGQKITDDAKFCKDCGAAVKKASADKKKPIEAKVLEMKSERPQKHEIIFCTKTDLFLYEKRGDANNILKKNIFYKPSRYRLSRNSRFKIIETIGTSYLVESIPGDNVTSHRGWVQESELLLRSDWQKK